MNRDNFDLVIGRLDRVLSEFLCLYEPGLDEPDRQTLKHHADDLIGVGSKMHELLNQNGPEDSQDTENEDTENESPAAGQETVDSGNLPTRP